MISARNWATAKRCDTDKSQKVLKKYFAQRETVHKLKEVLGRPGMPTGGSVGCMSGPI